MSTLKQILNEASPARRSLLSAVAGFTGFGVWAYWANIEHGQGAALKAALTQGSFSFIVTFVNTHIIECVYRALDDKRCSLAATVLFTSVLVCAMSWLINVVLGTPEILITILPGCVISVAYALAYTLTLRKVKLL